MAEKEYTPTNWVNDSEPDIDAEHLNNIEKGIDGLYKPEFDDSGTVEGIANFPEFLGKIVTKMNPIAFYKNFKAGMKFVLHAGQLVNNGLCNEPGKYPLDAAYGKTLADQVTKLNSDLRNNWAGVVSIIPKITADSTGTWASGTANITQSGLLRIIGNTNGEYGMVKLSINNQDVLGYQNSAGLYTFSYRVRKGDIVGVSVVNTANVEASLLTL